MNKIFIIFFITAIFSCKTVIPKKNIDTESCIAVKVINNIKNSSIVSAASFNVSIFNDYSHIYFGNKNLNGIIKNKDKKCLQQLSAQLQEM